MTNNKDNNHKNNDSFFKHPVVVSIISIALGTYVINYLQNNYLEKKTIIEQRLDIAHSVVQYAANAQTIMRKAEQLHKLRIKNNLTNDQFTDMQRQLQDSVNTNYEFASKAYMDFAIYFSKEKSKNIFTEFTNLENLHNEAMNIVVSENIRSADYPSKFKKYYQLLTNKAAEVIAKMRGDIPLPLLDN